PVRGGVPAAPALALPSAAIAFDKGRLHFEADALLDSLPRQQASPDRTPESACRSLPLAAPPRAGDDSRHPAKPVRAGAPRAPAPPARRGSPRGGAARWRHGPLSTHPRTGRTACPDAAPPATAAAHPRT